MEDKYRKMDARELDRYFRETGGDPRFVTEDNYPIRDGEVYWNNELNEVKIDFKNTSFGQYWDGWFATLEMDQHGVVSKGAVMNAERLAKWFEGKEAGW